MKCLRKMVGFALALLFTTGTIVLHAQPAPPQPQQPLDPLLQLMITQPSIEVTSNIQVTATFDPPMVKPGEKSIYRVTFNALSDSIQWPEKLNAPAALTLRPSARGQMLMPGEGKLKPQTTINYHVRTAVEGSYAIPSFEVSVYGRSITVPAARLMVSGQAPSTPPTSLELELARTNVYVGEPLNVRALMKATAGNLVQGIYDLRFNGEGFLVDLGTARQSISVVQQAGGSLPAYTYETTLTPLETGNLTFSAHGFTAGNRFTGSIIIQGQVTIPGGLPQYQLIDSDPVVINVRPLPRAGELPGFTGAMGRFIIDPPQLSTNQVRAGEIVKLFVTIRGEGNLARLVPPRPPTEANWQAFEATPGGVAPQPGAPPAIPGTFVSFTYTLIPLTAGTSQTPAIPFSYFDPESGEYFDLTIPRLPITVAPGTSTVDAPTLGAMTQESIPDEKKLRLSDVTEQRGWTAGSLTPLQQRGWFMGLQLLPLVGFLAVWKWDQHRRFLEQHPEIVVRRRARRALQREKRKLQAAVNAADEQAYVATAVRAMQVAAAPHFSAEPRALVSRDVLETLNGNGAGRDIVQSFFAASDASLFSTMAPEKRNLLARHPEFENVLNELEAKL